MFQLTKLKNHHYDQTALDAYDLPMLVSKRKLCAQAAPELEDPAHDEEPDHVEDLAHVEAPAQDLSLPGWDSHGNSMRVLLVILVVGAAVVPPDCLRGW